MSFEFEGQDVSTFGKLGDFVVAVAKAGDRDKAQRFMDAYTAAELPLFDNDEGIARSVAFQNVGYVAGYYGPEERDEVYDIFGTEHPIFGKRSPSAQEAFDAGKRLATRRSATGEES